MHNSIQQLTHRLWTSNRKTKNTTGGWVAGNACCCHHNGETADRRTRGGLLITGNDIVYNCFNCRFVASYTPGQYLNHKFKKLLSWMGASESEIFKASFEAMREKELYELTNPPIVVESVDIDFAKCQLPNDSISARDTMKESNPPKEFADILEYANTRRFNFSKYDFYWSKSLSKRLIIPFYWKNEIIGYTARSIASQSKTKYLTEVDSGYVFNIDEQHYNRRFVLVSEGPFDAMAIDGVAVLHGTISKKQIDIIESLNRDIVVVPDFQKSGSGLVEVAKEQGWAVAFPLWAEQEKDAADAVKTFGKLFTIKDIVDNIEHSRLKIDLMWRKYGSN